jgi:hypothetical protein
MYVMDMLSTDAAGNLSPVSSVSWIFDTTSPDHTVTVGGECVRRGGVTVCPGHGLLRVSVRCDVGLDASLVAPCKSLWQLYASNGDPKCDGVLTLLHDWDVVESAVSEFVPATSTDGRYVIRTQARDEAGNIGASRDVEFWIDSLQPTTESAVELSSSDSQESMAASRTARVQIRNTDPSPGQPVFWFAVSEPSDVLQAPLVRLPCPDIVTKTANGWTTTLTLSSLSLETVYNVTVWYQDQAGWFSEEPDSFTFAIMNAPPPPRIVSVPAVRTSSPDVMFALFFQWPDSGPLRGAPVFDVELLVVIDSSRALFLNGTSPDCVYSTASIICNVSVRTDAGGQHSFHASTIAYGRSSVIAPFLWTYVKCTPVLQYTVIGVDGNASCAECADGMDCTDPLNPVVARGYWATPRSFSANVFYKCHLGGACLGGANLTSLTASTSNCADGYGNRLCSACDDGYFLQYGKCNKCPNSVGASVGVMLGIVFAMIVGAAILVRLRNVLPIVQLKVGVSMLQVLAASNTAYDIPWPPAFKQFLDYTKVVLVDLFGLIPATCAQPMTYYTTLIVTLVTFKLVLLLIFVLPWLWGKVASSVLSCLKRCKRRLAACRSLFDVRYRYSKYLKSQVKPAARLAFPIYPSAKHVPDAGKR